MASKTFYEKIWFSFSHLADKLTQVKCTWRRLLCAMPTGDRSAIRFYIEVSKDMKVFISRFHYRIRDVNKVFILQSHYRIN